MTAPAGDRPAGRRRPTTEQASTFVDALPAALAAARPAVSA
ncbi:hypothetical protein [Georgenia sp. SUBG003]